MSYTSQICGISIDQSPAAFSAGLFCFKPTLVAGCWSLDTRYSMLVSGLWSLVAGYWIEQRTAEPQNIEPQNFEGWNRCALSFLLNRQNTFLRHSTFMIRYSTFAFFKSYALRPAPWTLYLKPYTLYPLFPAARDYGLAFLIAEVARKSAFSFSG